MTEQQYLDACFERERAEREAAEACNEILEHSQACALLEAMTVLPLAAVAMAEWVFEEYGWPASDLDEMWLNTAGRVTWECFRLYNEMRG